MKKGFKITFDNSKKAKERWEFKWVGNEQGITNFDFGDGKTPILKCAKCGAVHWENLK